MPPSRISVVGTTGSGKTTFARRLAAALDAPHAGWRPEAQADPCWSHLTFVRLRRPAEAEAWLSIHSPA